MYTYTAKLNNNEYTCIHSIHTKLTELTLACANNDDNDDDNNNSLSILWSADQSGVVIEVCLC